MKILLRLASVCLLFFALGHSIGHFTRHQVSNPKAKEVLQMMIDNKFDMFGQLRSYDENYTGMSTNLILTLLAFALIIWILANFVHLYPSLVRQILLPMGLCILGFAITSYLYFFLVPAITCLIAFILISMTIFKLYQQ